MDWLKIARAPSTRAKIRSWFRHKEQLLEEEKPVVEELQKEPVKFQPKPVKKLSKTDTPGKHLVSVDGRDDDLRIVFPKCCHPIPYDDIVGYVSRGKGITIHRRTCTNYKNLSREQDRIVSVHWMVGDHYAFVTGLSIKVKDEQGALAKISQAISDEGINVLDLRAFVSTKNSARITAKVQIENMTQLDKLMAKISRIDCVEKVKRI